MRRRVSLALREAPPPTTALVPPGPCLSFFLCCSSACSCLQTLSPTPSAHARARSAPCFLRMPAGTPRSHNGAPGVTAPMLAFLRPALGAAPLLYSLGTPLCGLAVVHPPDCFAFPPPFSFVCSAVGCSLLRAPQAAGRSAFSSACRAWRMSADLQARPRPGGPTHRHR
ncbi:unnamed protein product [Gadus morhua 'NCC']